MKGLTITVKKDLEKSVEKFQEAIDIINRVLEGEMNVEELGEKIDAEYTKAYRYVKDNFDYYIRKELGDLSTREYNFLRLYAGATSPIEKLFADAFDLTFAFTDFPEYDEGILLREYFKVLSEKEKYVIRRRYGFDCEPMTLEEIATEYGATRERIRQIKEKALRKLRKPTMLVKIFPTYNTIYEANKEKEKKLKERIAKICYEYESDEDLLVNLGLSSRPYNVLYRAGYRRISELKYVPEFRLASLRSMGKKSLAEIMTKLELYQKREEENK